MSLTTRCSRVWVLFDVYLDFYYQIQRHLMIELDKFLLPLPVTEAMRRPGGTQVSRTLEKQCLQRVRCAEYTCSTNAGWGRTPQQYSARRSRFLRDPIHHCIRQWWVGPRTLVDACDAASCFRHHFRMWFIIALDNSYFNWNSLASSNQPTTVLLRQILSKNLRTVFSSNPHPHLNIKTGKKLARPAGGPNAVQDIMRRKHGRTILEFGAFLLGLSRIFL